MSLIEEKYIKPGKVRFVYKHMAILGPESVQAASASECADEQEMFWDFHRRLYADQVENGSYLSSAQLITIASGAGLNVNRFSECLTANKYQAQIEAETIAGQSLGIRGTPMFLINGVFVSGAQPYEVFEEIIEEVLSKEKMQ